MSGPQSRALHRSSRPILAPGLSTSSKDDFMARICVTNGWHASTGTLHVFIEQYRNSPPSFILHSIHSRRLASIWCIERMQTFMVRVGESKVSCQMSRARPREHRGRQFCAISSGGRAPQMLHSSCSSYSTPSWAWNLDGNLQLTWIQIHARRYLVAENASRYFMRLPGRAMIYTDSAVSP